MDYNIPGKANRVLNIIILGLLLILLRVWYLSIIQHDTQLQKARIPKRRTVMEKIERATIRDRFNIPLALNKLQYNAAICYADIRHIPAAKWETDANGKRTRVPVRSAYIKQLSDVLAQELNLDAQAIEDTIHGKASLFPHTPFILKEELSEEEYYRLKLMEKDWVGIRTEKGSKRYYPLGKIGADVIGYMGSISAKEYYAIAQELGTLQTYLSQREEGEVAALPKGFHNPLEVRQRLKTLQEKAYTINDLVGKAGVEGAFDQDLRGYAAKTLYEVDTKGNILRALPGGRKAVSGQRLLLSLSSELQEFAETLLIHNESLREMRHADGTPNLSTPWIKGGAIVAIDPNTAEVLALASYPRVDPNDFIPSGIPEVKAARQAAIINWLESQAYIGEIWDGKRALEREKYRPANATIYNEKLELTLDNYFKTILAANSDALAAMQKITTLGRALSLQEEVEQLLQLSGQDKMKTLIGALYADASPMNPEEKNNVTLLLEQAPEALFLKKKIDTLLGPIKYNADKLLVLDLCRMIVSREHFTPDLIEQMGSLPLSEYRLLNQSASIASSFLKTHMKPLFHKETFQKWRESSFKEYLKNKRKEEKEKKLYAKPYTDYLDQVEKQMFDTFWQEHHLALLHAFVMNNHLREKHPTIAHHTDKLQAAIAPLNETQQKQFLSTLRSFDALSRPLYGRYRSLRNTQGKQLEKHLAAAFYPLSGYGYGRSQAFRQSTPQGSVFKIVVAYQALFEQYQKLKELQQTITDCNPLTLIDNLKWHPKPGSIEQILGYTLSGEPIKRLYKGGKLPRSHPNIGKIDVTGAIEQSSNLYFPLLTVDHMASPLNLIQSAREFGFGEKTGIELPGEIAGTLPDDVTHNQTGLYAFAIGQHSLIVTPLQTAVMLGAIANKGKVLKPKVIQVIAGQEPLREYRDPFSQIVYPFKDNLASIGIHFPLFTATQAEGINPYVWYNATEVKRTLFMPDPIRDPIIDGMHKVITGSKGTARPNIIRALNRDPVWMRNFQALKNQLIGKTGTAEILYKQTLDAESSAYIQNHIWFGGIAFADEANPSWDNPELVVVIYLRFSEAGGKEAAPLAAEIVKKWREIRASHGSSAYVVSPSDAPTHTD